jgi:heme oxygenase
MGATTSDIDALERCLWLPPIKPAGLYGYAYVILGSMMGGKIIVEQLRTVLGPAASFHFYGDGNGRSESAWVVSFGPGEKRKGKRRRDLRYGRRNI